MQTKLSDDKQAKELAQVIIGASVGKPTTVIVDAIRFSLLYIFANIEKVESGAGVGLFTIFARIVNTDMKRDLEMMISAAEKDPADATSTPEQGE